MARSTRLAFVLALIAAGGGPGLAQPVPSPPGAPAAPVRQTGSHPYKTALGAVANYGSCGVRARAAPYRALTAAMREIEAAAAARGLGPTLERLRQEYYQLLAISTMMACSRGPDRALADARAAVAAFRTWVAEQPDIR